MPLGAAAPAKARRWREVTQAKRPRTEWLLAAALIAPPVLLYRMLWDVNLLSWADQCLHSPPASKLPAVGLLLLNVILHEALHGVGFIAFGHISWRTIRFGVKAWPRWTPYTTCTQPVCVQAYRQAVLLPLLWLAVIPGVIGFVWHINALALWAVASGSGCTSDLILFWNSFKHQPSTVLRMQQ